MKYVESEATRVCEARTCSAKEVWFGWLAAVLSPDDNTVSPCSRPRCDVILLQTRRGAPAQTKHIDLFSRTEDSPGYYIIVTGEVRALFYGTPSSHLYAHYSFARKNLLKEAFATEAVNISPFSVSFDQGYVPHASSEWRGAYGTRHNSYLIPENHEMPDAKASGYE